MASFKINPSSLTEELKKTSVLAFTPGIAVALMVPILHHLYHDYRVFISLGPGGTPKTLSGYMRVKSLSFFALRNPYSAPPIPRYLRGTSGYLTSLPRRQGQRPETAGIAPHRQITQEASKEVFDALAAAINLIGTSNDNLVLGTSCFEKHGTGLFSVSPARRTCKGEICHAHPSDGSLHMTLHPADAKLVLDAGLGERHPLARGGWLERFVPGGFVMVYAPRSEEEISLILEIIRAAAWFVGGVDGLVEVDMMRRDSGYVSGEELC